MEDKRMPEVGVRSAEIASGQRLRGADAVYTAVAERFGSLLVTLDREQRERAAPLVGTRTPAEALANF